MKAILVVIDGLKDNKISELDNKSTFAYARHPNIDRLTNKSLQGYMDTCPKGYVPESMVCILSILGIDRKYFPSGRAALEVLSAGYPLQEDEVVLRCNLVSIDKKDRLISFNGGSLSKKEMAMASDWMLQKSGEFTFIPLAEYRNLLVMPEMAFKNRSIITYPPHEYLGQNIHELLKDSYSSSDKLADFIRLSSDILQDFNDGEQRYLFYPWGLSRKNKLPLFNKIFRKKAAAVCCADISRGIALALGMYVPDIQGITGDTDTNLCIKAETACALLEEYDFVFVHINGTDEASHRCDYREKVRFIERIDREFIAFLLENIDPQIRIMLCTDHVTDPISGKHAHGPVPFIIKGAEIMKSEPERKIENPRDVLNYLLSE